MGSIREHVGCFKCGCPILPDAVKCPNCGTNYNSEESSVVNNHSFPAKVRMREVGVEAIVAYYQFTCPYHGRINVRATVTTSTLRCPFC